MDIEEVYKEVLPYLSDPRALKEFLEKSRDKSNKEIIEMIEIILPDSKGPIKTDLRIFLNALLKDQ